MLSKLKNELESCNFRAYNNFKILFGELLISAKEFTGYSVIKEQVAIVNMIDSEIFHIKCLNNNIIKVTLK